MSGMAFFCHALFVWLLDGMSLSFCRGSGRVRRGPGKGVFASALQMSAGDREAMKRLAAVYEGCFSGLCGEEREQAGWLKVWGTGMEHGNVRNAFYDFAGGFHPEPVRLDERFSALDELVVLWEASVRSTHDFLPDGDIGRLRPIVRMALESVPHVWGMLGCAGQWGAFMGIDGEKLEMLFVHPAVQGNGLGRRLVEKAIHECGVRLVDVNEQNPKASGFYQRLGFSVTGRSETDGQGNPFPLLHLEWTTNVPVTDVFGWSDS